MINLARRLIMVGLVLGFIVIGCVVAFVVVQLIPDKGLQSLVSAVLGFVFFIPYYCLVATPLMDRFPYRWKPRKLPPPHERAHCGYLKVVNGEDGEIVGLWCRSHETVHLMYPMRDGL